MTHICVVKLHDVTSGNVLGTLVLCEHGQGQEGGCMHPMGANSMAASGLGSELALGWSRWAISQVINVNWP